MHQRRRLLPRPGAGIASHFVGDLTLRVCGPIDPTTAWQRYAEPRLWSTWAPHIRGVDYALDRLHTGTSGAVIGPLGLRLPFTIDAIDEENRTWSWTVQLRTRGHALVTVDLDHGVEAGGTGTATWLRLRGAWPVILAYAPVSRWALRYLVR